VRKGRAGLREFAIELFLRAIKDWRLYAGVVTLAFAITASLVGHAIVLPAWIWWVAAVVSAYAIAVKAEWKLYQSRASAVAPDMRLQDVLRHIIGSDNLFGSDNPQRTADALFAVREKAHLGQVSAWGRRNVGVQELAAYPLTPIPSEYWEEFGIGYLALLRDLRGETERAEGPDLSPDFVLYSKPDVIYRDLWFCRSQVRKSWPLQKARLNWRLPWEIRADHPMSTR
jgi:hypothetical protein